MEKKKSMNRHYVFWGEAKDGLSDWMQWLEDAKEIFALLGESPSHYAISTLELEDIKMRPIGGLSRKLANIQKKGHTMDYAEFDLLRLRDGFWDSLEFYISTCRTRKYENLREMGIPDFIYCAIDLEYVQEHGELTPVIEQRILQLLERNIVPYEGEVFETRNKIHGLEYIFDCHNEKQLPELVTPNILMKFDGKEWREI